LTEAACTAASVKIAAPTTGVSCDYPARYCPALETTSMCVIDDAGAIIWRGKCSSDPDTITAMVRQHAPGAVRVGLETEQLSN
jgi:hypothetical protein